MIRNPQSLEAPAAGTATLAEVDAPSTRRRYEIAPWDLSDLLESTDDEVVRAELDALEVRVEAFVALRGELVPEMEPERFLEVMRDYEAMVEHMDRLSAFASLFFASDTQSPATVGFRNHIRQVMTRLHNRFLFFSLWWQGLEEEQAARLLPPKETEEDFHSYLSELRRFKPYTLDERSEQLINIKNSNGIDAVLTLYSMLTNRLEFQLEIDGEEQQLTEGEMRSLFYSPDPVVRKDVCREVYRVYERDAEVLAQIYANRVRDWHAEYVETRGMPSPISVRNLSNDIPDAAIETLLDVVHRNAHIFQDYFRLKGRWLGFTPLRRYDLYAPLATSNQLTDYGDAVANVLDTFREFDDRFADLAEKVLAENHVDAAIRKGKRGGAFCSTVLPRLTPWVLVNYAGRVRDISTLAHELGHAVHSQLASGHSIFTQHSSLPLAETASVFSEMLMTDRLLAQERDPTTRRELLASAVDDVYATVMRQTYFVRFELAAHQAVLENKSSEYLFDLYAQNLAEQFGDSLDVSPELRYEWISIPHLFNTPFYCYAYSFGQLLVLALYRRYQQEGDAFKPGYFRLLSTGGAGRPAEMLRELDIDITDAAFWQSGFDVVRDMIDELRSLDNG